MNNETALEILQSTQDKLRKAFTTNSPALKDLYIKEAQGQLSSMIIIVGGSNK